MFTALHRSGNAYDDTLLAKFESVYTDSGDHSSTMVGDNSFFLPQPVNFCSHNRLSPTSLLLVVCFQRWARPSCCTWVAKLQQSDSTFEAGLWNWSCSASPKVWFYQTIMNWMPCIFTCINSLFPVMLLLYNFLFHVVLLEVMWREIFHLMKHLQLVGQIV